MSEKKGGCQNTTPYMNNFINFSNKRNLLSQNASRFPFTWRNNHIENSRIYEDLINVLLIHTGLMSTLITIFIITQYLVQIIDLFS